MKSKKILRYVLIVAVVAVAVLVVGKKKGWFGNEFKIKVAVEKETSSRLLPLTAKFNPKPKSKSVPRFQGKLLS